MKERTYIVFDIGGIKTRVARVINGELEGIRIFDTPKTPEEGIPQLVSEIKEAAGEYEVDELCGDMSGIVKTGTIYISPNLPAWNGTHVVRALQNAFNGAPVTFFNDAEMVALGEYHFGAGKGESNMVYLTISTGVGAVHVLHGKIDRGQYNAEAGHHIIQNGLELEELISGTAVHKKYGVHPKDLTDPTAHAELARLLAVGIYNMTLFWSPKVVVLGGSMIVGQNAISIAQTSSELVPMVKKYYPDVPELRKAHLAEHGGLHGARAYLLHRVH